MAKKLCPKSYTLASSFNQARQVCHSKGFTGLCPNHSKIRYNGREMISANFRFSRSDNTQKSGFPNRRKPNQTNICQNFQFQLEFTFLSRFTVFRNFWCWIFRRRKANIATTSTTSMSYDELLPIFNQICQDFPCFSITNRRPLRYMNNEVFCSTTVHSLGHPLFTRLSLKMTIVTKIHQSAKPFIYDKNNIAATTTVTAPRSSIWDILFTAESYHAITAIASLDFYLSCIQKHTHIFLFSRFPL